MTIFKSREINFHGFLLMSDELALVTLTNKLTGHLSGQILKKTFLISDQSKDTSSSFDLGIFQIASTLDKLILTTPLPII
jgi:hypothetical protein